MPNDTRPTLHLVGQPDGPPSFEDILKLSEALTGRPPTPEEIAEARREWETFATTDPA